MSAAERMENRGVSMDSMPTKLTRRLVVALITLAVPVAGLRSEDVPYEVQAAILTRMLSYDRAMRARAGSTVVVGIVAKPDDRSSAQAQAKLAKAILVLQSGRVPGLPITVVTAGYKDPADLTAWLAQKRVHVLYVEPALSKELKEIQDVCVAKRIVSVTPVRDFVERGLVVGIVRKGDRPGILVNLPAAVASGMDLDPKLLELSEIIR
jgi:hypothetical protein